MPKRPLWLSDLNQLMVGAHFSLAEFECKGKYCCAYTAKVDPRIVTVLEVIRARINERFQTAHHKVIITSGFRCPRHNKEQGGKHHSFDPLDSRNSYHTHGLAVDIACRTIPKRQLALICRDLAENGPVPFRVGYYWRGIAEVLHIDLADWQQAGLAQIFGDAWNR